MYPELYIDIGQDECLARHEGIRTNTFTPARGGGVNKLTAYFSLPQKRRRQA